MAANTQIPNLLHLLKSKYGELAPVLDGLLELYHGLAPQASGMDMSFLESYPPGHYYSPLLSMEEVYRVAPCVWRPAPESLPGIDLRARQQQQLFAKFLKYYSEMPFSAQRQANLRYYFDNNFFGHADAIALYCIIREYKPKRIIEVGSGFSSCVMLDTDEKFLDSSIQFTFIEPYPERLLENLTAEDRQRTQLIKSFVQDIDLSLFGKLQENDILFLDCSHVGKLGSDVLHLLFEVLPQLNSGVLIHVHDIFYPFEYPQDWVLQNKRAWNESYFLRAFLQYNTAFEITYFNSYLSKMHRQMLQAHMPLVLKNTGSSLWLRKVAG